MEDKNTITIGLAWAITKAMISGMQAIGMSPEDIINVVIAHMKNKYNYTLYREGEYYNSPGISIAFDNNSGVIYYI